MSIISSITNINIVKRIKCLVKVNKQGFSVFWIIASYTITALFSLRELLFNPGTIGLSTDFMFPPYQEQYRLMFYNVFSSIAPWAGGQAVFAKAAYPLDLLFGSGSFLGLGGEIISKSFVFSAVFFSGVFSFYLCRTTMIDHLPSAIAGFFYMFTPVVHYHFFYGHVTYMVSYALVPLSVALFMKSFKKPHISLRMLFLAGIVYALSWAQGQVAIGLLALFLLYCFFARSYRDFGLRIAGLATMTIIAICLHLSWLLLGFSTEPEALPAIFTTFGIKQASSSLLYSLRLLSQNASPYLTLESLVSSFVLPVLAFSALIFKPKDRNVIFFALCSIIAIFFGKGVYPPFGWLWSYLVQNTLARTFYEIYHIMFIPALGYTVLIGFALQSILNRITQSNLSIILGIGDAVKNESTSEFSYKIRFKPGLLKILVSILLIAIILMSCSSWFFNGKISPQNVQVYSFPTEYQETLNYFDTLPEDFNIAWLPLSSVGFSSYSTLATTGRDPMVMYSPKSAIDTDTVLWERSTAFLAKTIDDTILAEDHLQRTQFYGSLLSKAGVKYIIGRDDFKGHYQSWVSQNMWNQTQLLDGQKDLVLTKQFGNISIFENNAFGSSIFSTGQLLLVAGDLSAFVQLDYLYNLKNMASSPLIIFASQLSPNENWLFDVTDTVVVQEGDYEDLLLQFLPVSCRFDAGTYATKNTNPNFGWTYGGYSWPSGWEYTISLDSIASTLVSDTLEIPFQASNADQYNIMAKVFFGESTSNLFFSVDNRRISTVSTQMSLETGFRWVQIGTVGLNQGKHILQVLSDGGENIVGTILITPSYALEEATKTLDAKIDKKDLIILSEFEKSMIPNDLLVPTTEWGSNATGGVAMKSLAAVNVESRIFVPFTGDYNLFLSTTSPEYVNRGIQEKTMEKKIGNLEKPSNWSIIGTGQILSSDFAKTQDSSMVFSIPINKTAEENHVIYNIFPSNSQNWTDYDSLNFWVYPETSSNSLTTYVIFSASNYDNQWYSANLYLKNNDWTYVHLDISTWLDRSDIAELRLVGIGDAWGSTVDGQVINFYFNDLTLSTKIPNAGAFQLYDASNISLEKGYNNIETNIAGANLGIDLIVLQYGNTSNHDNSADPVVYSKINPAKYELEINATEPFFLVFTNKYYSTWQAQANGTTFAHFIANGFVNGFYVDKLGHYSISIEFEPQKTYELGMTISFLAIVFCSFIILFPRRLWRRLKFIGQSKVVRGI